MTRMTNARVAGFTYVFYIAVGVTMLVLDRSTRADGTLEHLALIAAHATVVRVPLLLSLLVTLTALTLAVSLYALTRDQDRDLATLALTCRIGEGMLGAVGVLTTLGLLWLATVGHAAADAGATASLGGLLVQVGAWNTKIAAFRSPVSRAPSPQVTARTAGVFYLITYLTGLLALTGDRGRIAAGLISSACYVGVTVAFFFLFKPVNQGLSLLAACVSLAGCALGALNAVGLTSVPINALVFFGVYCLLIGYLIFQSALLPRFLGVLMAFGGLGWLTFVSPSLAQRLAPYNFAPGLLGEGVLTIWLLVRGVVQTPPLE